MSSSKSTIKKASTNMAAVFSILLFVTLSGTGNSTTNEPRDVSIVGSSQVHISDTQNSLIAEASDENKEEKDIQFPFTFDTIMV